VTRSDRSLPPLLAALHAVKHQIDVDADNRAENDDDDDDDDERIDYEAYPEFESAARTESWIQAWTGGVRGALRGRGARALSVSPTPTSCPNARSPPQGPWRDDRHWQATCTCPPSWRRTTFDRRPNR